MVRFLLSVFILGCLGAGGFIIHQGTNENQIVITICGFIVAVIGFSFVPWLFSPQTKRKKENLYIVDSELEEITRV